MPNRTSRKNTSFFNSFGSVGRNLKRLVTLSAFLFTADAATEHARYKARIHKNFIKQVFDTNFPVIMTQLESLTSKSKYLTDINAQLDRVNLKIKAEEGYDPENSDLFFDDENMIISLTNLMYEGTAFITDMETNVKESITITSQLDPIQIVLKLSTVEENGKIYPKIDTISTKLNITPGSIQIDAQGDLPLYKTAKFEQGIKSWLMSQNILRETNFKNSLQKAERQIMESFEFKKDFQIFKGDNVGRKNVLHSTLAEKLTIKGDHLILDFNTKYEGKDLKPVSHLLQKHEPEFNEQEGHDRDVQVIYDENQINHFLYTMFYDDKPFSLAETLVTFLPEQMQMGAPMLKQMFNTQTLSVFFPDLKKYGQQKADLRCSMSKDQLEKGKIDSELSTVKYMDGDMLHAEMHFGCSILIYGSKNDDQKEEVDLQIDGLFDMLNAMTGEEDNKKWRKYRKFFISAGADVKFDFSEGAKTFKIPYQDNIQDLANTFGFANELKKLKLPKLSEHLPFIFARVLDFDPMIHQLKIYKDETDLVDDDELSEEAQHLRKMIKDMRGSEWWDNPIITPIKDIIFGNSIPVAPYPTVENCLGLKPKNSQMSIHDGYAVMSFDYKTTKANQDCLFNMAQYKQEMKAKKQAQGGRGGPGGMPGMPPGGGDPGKMMGAAVKKLSEQQPVVGEVLKGVQGLMKNKEMQDMAKQFMKGPMQGLNDVNKEINPMNLLGKLFQQ